VENQSLGIYGCTFLRLNGNIDQYKVQLPANGYKIGPRFS